MCGIAGILAYHDSAQPVDRKELIRIRDAMTARGPDGAGEWFSSERRVGLGHRRLSIIDLSDNGSQPMVSADGKIIISFNGEIYNYRELRADLEAKGCSFRSKSDTEVLLHLYNAKGEAMVHDLRGMFAFVLWDENKKAMFMARDPYGIKPLYYADDGKTMRVASQVKALLAGGMVSRERDAGGCVGFFLFGSVPEPLTTYKTIKALPAGSYVWVDSHGLCDIVSYHSFSRVLLESGSPKGLNPDQAVREALLDSVRNHFVSDVPVGIFLSAGVDSGSLIGLARDCGIEKIQTITLAFDEFKGRPEDESPLAQQVAHLYGTDHHTYLLGQHEFEEELPKILDAMDQPSIDGINTYFVSKAAAKHGLKVALSGLGGDELFGGYPSFRDIPRIVHWMSAPSRLPFVKNIFKQIYSSLSGRGVRQSPKYAGLMDYGGSFEGAYFLRRGLFMPWELGQVMNQELAREGLKQLDFLKYIRSQLGTNSLNDFAKVSLLESTLYMRNQLLRDADWAGMAHSLEIRTPYVDAFLFKALAPLICRNRLKNKKPLVASPKKSLPVEITTRAKTGFSVPIHEWLISNRNLASWKENEELKQQGCHWSRRWAFTVSEEVQV